MSEVLSPRDAYKLLPDLRKAVVDPLKQFSRSNTIVALLCFEDGYDNLNNAIARSLFHPELRHPDTSEHEQTAVHRFIRTTFEVIDEALSYVLHFTPESPLTLKDFPAIEPGISGASPDDTVKEWVKSGRIELDDDYFVSAVRLLGAIEGSQIVVLKGGRAQNDETYQLIKKILNWTQSMWALHRVNQGIHLGYSFKRVNGHLQTIYPSTFDPFEALEAEGLSPRKLLHSDTSVPDWASRFKQVSVEGMLHIGEGIDSFTNRQSLQSEIG
ncbi:MAG: hypothetical protein ACREAN_01425, partial [Nitrosopumilaceae archaeon]